MEIVSIKFLVFIAGVVCISWLGPKHLQVSIVGVATALCLIWYSPISFLLLAALSFVVYFCLYLSRSTFSVICIIIAITAVIVWYKLGREIDVYSIRTGSSMVPLLVGFSYYTLRLLHYTIEAWKQGLPKHNFIQFLQYMWFLPTIIAGPINRFAEFNRSLRRRRWDSELFSQGLERILYGYVKIIILGNYLISIKLNHFIATIDSSHPAISTYLGYLSYGLNLYFQFAGYSDVAIGFALLLGFQVMENFSYPFVSLNINDFWQRWHISLSRWCRDYVYIPVISLCRTPACGVVSSMIVLALWHEFSLRYLAWGVYHGLGIAVWQYWSRIKAHMTYKIPSQIQQILKLISWFVTMNFVILSFAFTKEKDIESALTSLVSLFSFGG